MKNGVEIDDLLKDLAAQAWPDWMKDGACRGADTTKFFPDRAEPAPDAIEVCRLCRVRDACGEYALRNRIKTGVWGGLTERERDRLLHQSGAA